MLFGARVFSNCEPYSCNYQYCLVAVHIGLLVFNKYLSSEDLSRLAARKYARVIQKLGFPVSKMHCNSNGCRM